MKKFGIAFMTIGVIVMIIGYLIWPNLSHVNAVDSNTWTININGYKSFRWPIFLGGIIFMIGALDACTWGTTRGKRVN